jgi:hypothetical protein
MDTHETIAAAKTVGMFDFSEINDPKVSILVSPSTPL